MFSKVWSLELIFLAWNWGFGNKFSLKCVSQKLKFKQNRRKLSLKMNLFSKNKSGVSGSEKGLEILGLRSYGLKRGVRWAARPCTTFQSECPPSSGVGEEPPICPHASFPLVLPLTTCWWNLNKIVWGHFKRGFFLFLFLFFFSLPSLIIPKNHGRHVKLGEKLP